MDTVFGGKAYKKSGSLIAKEPLFLYWNGQTVFTFFETLSS